MDVNLRLYSDRLKRILAGEEGTLLFPDSTNLKPHFEDILTEIEIVMSLLRNYEGDMALTLFQLLHNFSLAREDIWEIVKEIDYFVHESEKFIDTIFVSSETASYNYKHYCEAVIILRSIIIDIRNRMQQLPPNQENADIGEVRDSLIPTKPSDSSSSSSSSGFEKNHMEELLDLLIEGQPQLSVVAICDSSGLDKTAFAAEAYNNNHAKYYFDCRIWVKVPMIYNFNTVLDQIMKCVMPPSKFSEITSKDLDYKLKKTILRDYMKNKKYLLFLDDVCNKGIWLDLREALSANKNGSRILMTVSYYGVLSSSEFESRKKIQFESRPLIAKTNGGLPCFILHYGNERFGPQKLETTMLTIFSVLELPIYLKACSLYLSAFMEPYEIFTRQLYQLWIAEGLIPGNSEATAEEYLKELICRGLIKEEKRRAEGTIIKCSVPSKIWSVLFLLASEINFVKENGEDSVHGRTIKRISLVKNMTQVVSLERSDRYLHSLLNFISESNHLTITDVMEICKKFKYLRVLNLGSLVLDQYPSGLENLFYLKYLKLNIPSLKSLPSSLCNLLNLYTVDMPSSYIDHTPEDIWKMDKLMHLNFGYIILPAHPGKYCSSLKNLSFISALHSKSCTPDILARLPNVQTLRIFGDLSYCQSEISKSLCQLLKLEHLKLVNEDKSWHISQMVLADYQFPPSLTHLSLSNTKLGDDPMPALEKLPHLQVLKLKENSYFGRKLACVGSGSFPQLKILHLKSMPWLEEWTVGVGALPKLECLIINPCSYLRRLPEELWRINSFRKLDLHWPQTELRKSLQGFEEMERYEIQKYPYGI